MFFASKLCSTEPPVLCLLKRSPRNKRYRAERPPFLFELWSVSEYLNSAPNSSNFVFFLLLMFGIFGWGYPLEVACRHPRRLRDDFVTIFDGFLLGSLEGTVGVVLAHVL